MKNVMIIFALFISATITYGQVASSATLNPISNFEHNEATLTGQVVSSTDSVFYYVECREVGQVNFETVSDTVLEFTTAGSQQGYSITAENLVGNTAYECRIATFIGEDSLVQMGNYSNVRSFTTLVNPQIPEVVSLTMETIGLTTAIVNIEYICGNILSQYVIDGLSTPITLDLIGQGDTSVLLMGLDPDTEYTIEVQGFNNQFFFGNTEEISFTTNAPVGGSASLENVDAELTEVSYDVSVVTELYDVEVSTYIVDMTNGDTITIWNSSSIASDTTVSVVAENLMPATEYRIYLSLEENGTASLQDVATFSTPPCQSPVIQTTATETHTSVTMAIEIETNEVSPFTSSVTVNMSDNQTGHVIYDETLATGLLGDTTFNISQAGLDPQNTYTVIVTVSGLCGATEETINVTTLSEPDPIEGPEISHGSISNPDVNTIRIPVTLDGDEGPINVFATVLNTTTNTVVETNTLVLSSVSEGLHIVDFGPYDPGRNFTITLVAEYADTASMQNSVQVNTFTQPGGNASVNGFLNSVTQNYGDVTFMITTGGYEGSIQLQWSGGIIFNQEFFPLRGDTMRNLNLGSFEPNTEVTVVATLTTSEFGIIQETITFTTLPEEEENQNPTSINELSGSDLKISSHYIKTPVTGTLIISDLLGRVIQKLEIPAGVTNITPAHQSGVYVYTFMYTQNGKNSMKTEKFMH